MNRHGEMENSLRNHVQNVMYEKVIDMSLPCLKRTEPTVIPELGTHEHERGAACCTPQDLSKFTPGLFLRETHISKSAASTAAHHKPQFSN